MGDVLEFLIDGTSGLAPGGVEGSCIVAGVCSVGTVGKGYLLGKDSDIEALLGVGPLTDRLKDVFAAGGQSPLVIAVPVAGLDGGYIAAVSHIGTGPEAFTSGVAADNADVVVEIVVGGALGTATYQLSEDGGVTFGSATATPANGQIPIGATGATLVLDVGTHVAADKYIFNIRAEIGPITKIGTGPDITTSGDVKANGDIIFRVTQGGARNTATYQLSLDGDSFNVEKTVPVDGIITVGTTGVEITVPDTPDMVTGDTYTFKLNPPVPSITGVMTALETPLDLYDVEYIYVVGPSDSTDWAAMGARADELWNLHRPTFFIAESRLPYDGEDLNDWTAMLVKDRQNYAHRFVSICVAFGEVSDVTGSRVQRNFAGLFAGRILSIFVQRAPGRVRDGGVSQGTLPAEFTSAMQATLEKEGFVTGRKYAGLRSVYWGDAKTLAEVTSDYQYIPVLRVVFKAIRLGRIAALKSMYDELGDPLVENNDNTSGTLFLKTNLEIAIETMTRSHPKELAAVVISIPDGQDVVNNGLAVTMHLIGIPIIRQIRLFAKFSYAGSKFDPRTLSVN